MGNELPLGDQVFILQSRIIKQLAEEGPCVILGRCGDYVLRERKDVLRVFVYAPKEWRLEYAKTNPLSRPRTKRASRTRWKRPTATVLPTTTTTPRTAGVMPTTMIWPSSCSGRETCVKMILDAAAAKEKNLADRPGTSK